MAWITPKTDWSEIDRCTYTDINRIAGNLNELGCMVKPAPFSPEEKASVKTSTPIPPTQWVKLRQ